MSKKSLAKAQIAQFDQALRAALPESDFIMKSAETVLIKNLLMMDHLNSHCDKKADADTVIKVLWLKDAESDKAASGINKHEDSIVYTYQVRVRER